MILLDEAIYDKDKVRNQAKIDYFITIIKNYLVEFNLVSL